MSSGTRDEEAVTVLGFGPGTRAVLVVGPAAVGAAAGLALPWLVEQVLRLPWVPFAGPLRLLDSVPDPWVTVVTVVLGLAAALAFTLTVFRESLVVEVGRDAVRLRLGDTVTSVRRDEVGAAFLDREDVVLLDLDGREVARGKHESTTPEVAEAFTDRGYPWTDGDPHAADLRRWVPGHPDVPAVLGALLAARQKALGRKDPEDAADLRREIGALGYVVRDEGDRQRWRAQRPVA